jgi:NAD(P)-dependent dehydrogenase (short-subunit alcohol dehydrogenase family)
MVEGDPRGESGGKDRGDDRRVVLVTGGASGIGLACARRLLHQGWCIGILDRDEAALAQVRSQFEGEPRVRVGSLDVTDEPAAEAAVQAMRGAFGRIDGVINSAGIGLDIPVLDTPVALFRKVIDINLTGTFIVGRAVARIMKEQAAGSIVNIASIAGLRGSSGRVAYGASKGGVVILTQVMAVDLAPFGIRVNAIAPGPVETPLVAALHPPEVRRAWIRHVPMRRYAKPEEIAGTAQFLLDEASSGYLTGEIIAVDGGFRGAGMMLD